MAESENTSGATLLAKGYVEAVVKISKAESDTRAIFDDVGKQADRTARDSGDALRGGIVGGLSRAGKDGAAELNKGIAGGVAKGVPGWRKTIADGLLAGMAENGDQAADTFRGRFVTGLAQGLQSDGGGIVAGLLDRFRSAGDEGGTSLAEGLSGGLKGASGTVREASEAVEGLGLEGAAAGVRLGGIGTALAGIVENPVVLATAAVVGLGAATFGVLDKLNDMGEAWEQTFDKIAVQTGASEEQVKGYENVVTAIAGKISQPVEKIGADVADVAQKFGDSGTDLATVTTEYGRLQSVIGNFNIKPIAEVVRGNSLDATGQTALLTDLLHAYQTTGDSIDDYSSALARATPVSKQLGLSERQTLGILTSLSASGIDPSRGVQGLSIAAEKALKSGKPLNDFLQNTIQQIKTLHDQGDEEGANKLADANFGAGQRGGGAAFVQAIESGKLASDNLTASLDKQGDTVDELYEKTKHAGGAWQELKNSIVTALAPATTALHGLVDKDLQGLSAWIASHRKSVVDFFVDVGEAAVDMAGFTVKSFGVLINGLGGLTNSIATTLAAVAGLADLVGAHGVADDIGNVAQSFKNAGDGMDKLGKSAVSFADDQAPKLRSALEGARGAGDDAATGIGAAAGKAFDFGNALKGIPPTTTAQINTPGLDEAVQKMQAFNDGYSKFLAGNPNVPGSYTPPAAPVPGGTPSVGALLLPPHATGGAINGVRRYQGDNQPIMAKVGEHVWTVDEVQAAGGHGAVRHIRSLVSAGMLKGYDDGGAITDGTGADVSVADGMANTPYSKGSRTDCSGMVGRVVEGALGVGGGLPTTKNMGPWLSALGFKSGIGPPGTMSVGWYDHGPGENDGHAAMTLSNGENAESGPAGKFVIGGSAAGASSAEFDQHMYLPQMWGEGQAGGGITSAASALGGGAPTQAQVSAASADVDKATGALNVASQKLDEANSAPLKTDKKGAVTKDAQAEHDRAVESATAAKARAQQGLDLAKSKKSGLEAGDPPAVVNATNAVTEALNKQTDAQAKLDKIRADPNAKPDQITAAQNALDESNRKVADSQTKLAEVQEKEGNKKPKDDKNDPVGQLGTIGGDFLKDNLPPGFSDPTSWPLVKTASSLLKDIGGAIKDPTAKAFLSAGGSALGGDFGGAATSLIGSIQKPFDALKLGSPPDAPGVSENPTDPGVQAGSGFDPTALVPNLPNLPSGTDMPDDGNIGDVNIDQSAHFHGDVGATDAAKAVVREHESVSAANSRTALHSKRVLTAQS